MPASATSAVADAGPLIALGRLDRLDLLPALFGQVLVPGAVLAECTARPERLDAKRVQAACDDGMLLICNATSISAGNLGAGERSAIGKALELRSMLLADDLAARRHAQSIGLPVIGTLGVLVRAKRMARVPAVAPLVEQLRLSGYWIGSAAVAAALEAAGERGR